MKKFPLPALSVISLVIVLLMTTAVCKAGFGLSPPWLQNDHLLPGDTYEQIIYLSRNEPDTEQKLTDLRKEGDKEVFKWITLPDLSRFVLPEGQKLTPMTITVKVPETAVPKQYKGDIYFLVKNTTQPVETDGGQVAIEFGGHLIVDLTVQDPNKPAEESPKKPALPGATQSSEPALPKNEPKTDPVIAQELPGNEVEEKEASPAPDLKPVATSPSSKNTPDTRQNAVILIFGALGMMGIASYVYWFLKKRNKSL